MDFQQLGLEQWIQKMCNKIDYRSPRPIQEQAIPHILEGKNVLISSQTGSGKTAAFALPILQHLSKDQYGIFCIVLTANRELALQIAEQFQIFGASINLKVCLLIGGMNQGQQTKQLAQIPHIIIATPGRCSQLLDVDQNFQKYIKNIQYVVLDEVDRLMEPQIWVDIENILAQCQNAKIHLVSATVQQLDEEIQTKFPQLEFQVCSQQQSLSDTIKHKFILMPDLVKDYYFVYLMKKLDGALTIVFAQTCRKCHELNEMLNELGISSTTLHSMLPQKERISNLKSFRSLRTQVLVATDVASRGLDIQNVKFVVNYNVPKFAIDYIHRVGRTGRAGKRGTAITLMTQYDVKRILEVEKEINLKLEEIKFNEEKVLENMVEITKAMKLIKVRMAQDGTTDKFKEMQEKKKISKQ
ncbi:hypothetical protein pb186bvf_019538 [Paramecium bursaria]